MLKGTATIELTNVKTGEVERYTEENMVTNAVNDILTLNPLGLRCCNTATSTSMIPVRGNAIGGVLLCENTLEEDPDKYYVPNDNVIVGYANTAVNTTEDPKRGSGNQSEQGMTEDKKGYKFVFDFTTSQGNGTISAIGLTGYAAGSVGRGSKYSNNNAMYNGAYRHYYFTKQPFGQMTDFLILHSLVALDAEKNQAISARVHATHQIKLWRFLASLTSIGLNDSVSIDPNNRVIEETVLTTQIFASATLTAETSSTTGVMCAFVPDGNGYIWGFEHANNASGNKTGNATVNWIKIKIDDFTFEEGTWTLAAQIWPFGNSQYHNYSLYGASSSYDNGAYPNNHYYVCNCCIHKGYLYCFKYDKTGVYKIELENPSNIVFMEYPDGGTVTTATAPSDSKYDTSKRLRQGIGLNVLGDDVYFANGVIENGKILPTKTADFGGFTASDYYNGYFAGTPYGLCGISAPCLNIGPMYLKWSMYDYIYGSSATSANRYILSGMCMNNLYLATINNLSKPVQKTADKTMKITYIIREEE